MREKDVKVLYTFFVDACLLESIQARERERVRVRKSARDDFLCPTLVLV